MGGGGSSGGGNSTTTNQTVFSPEEQAARSAIFGAGQQLYNTQAPTAGVYTGPKPVGFSNPSLIAQQMQLGTAQQGQGLGSQAMDSASFNLNNGRYVSSNPYLQDAIQAAVTPAIRNYNEVTMPGLRMGGMQSGSLGSSRQGVAEGIASRGLTDTIANTSATMANAGYNTGLDSANATLKNLPGIMTGAAIPGQLTSQVGSQLENRDAATEAYNSNVATWANAGPWQTLQNWANLLGSQSSPGSTTNSTGDSGGSSSGGLGGLGSLASLAMMGFSLFGGSDRRTKENIKRIGTADETGLPIYVYKHKGMPAGTEKLGFMADEVAQVLPGAVRDGPGGLKMVNYNLATTAPLADLFAGD